MRNIFIIILLQFILNYTSAQVGVRPVTFENVTPVWNVMTVDTISPDNNMAVNNAVHLVWYSDVYNDNLVVNVYLDVEPIYSGVFIETRSKSDGSIIWTNYFGLTSDSFKEQPEGVRIDNGVLKILSTRTTVEANTYTGFGKCILISREYDLSTGELLNEDFNENFTDLDTYYWRSTFYTIMPLDDESYYWYHRPVWRGNSGKSYRKYFDNEYTLVKEDTLTFNKNYDGFLSDSRSYSFSNGTIYTARYNSAQQPFVDKKVESLDSFDYVIDIYDDQFNYLDTKNVKDNFPYNWDFEIMDSADDFISILNQDSTDIDGLIPYSAVTVFDDHFEHRETLDFGQLDFLQVESVLIKGTNNQLFITNSINNGGKYYWTFYRSNGEGEINFLSDVIIEEDHRIAVFNISESDNLVMVNYYIDDMDSTIPNDRASAIVAFTKESLGLKTSTVSHRDNKKLSIFPNPSIDVLNINGLNRYVHYDLFDSNYHLMSSGVTEGTVDLITLSTGLYFIHFDFDNTEEIHSFIKL